MEKQIILYDGLFGCKLAFTYTIDNNLKINKNSPFLLRKLEEANRQLEGMDLSSLKSSGKKITGEQSSTNEG